MMPGPVTSSPVSTTRASTSSPASGRHARRDAGAPLLLPFGALLVAGWLAGIIVDLLTMGEYYDIALRDFGLLVAALALAALALDRVKGRA